MTWPHFQWFFCFFDFSPQTNSKNFTGNTSKNKTKCQWNFVSEILVSDAVPASWLEQRINFLPHGIIHPDERRPGAFETFAGNFLRRVNAGSQLRVHG
jgi:hypothetical protein